GVGAERDERAGRGAGAGDDRRADGTDRVAGAAAVAGGAPARRRGAANHSPRLRRRGAAAQECNVTESDGSNYTASDGFTNPSAGNSIAPSRSISRQLLRSQQVGSSQRRLSNCWHGRCIRKGRPRPIQRSGGRRGGPAGAT